MTMPAAHSGFNTRVCLSPDKGCCPTGTSLHRSSQGHLCLRVPPHPILYLQPRGRERRQVSPLTHHTVSVPHPTLPGSLGVGHGYGSPSPFPSEKASVGPTSPLSANSDLVGGKGASQDISCRLSQATASLCPCSPLPQNGSLPPQSSHGTFFPLNCSRFYVRFFLPVGVTLAPGDHESLQGRDCAFCTSA